MNEFDDEDYDDETSDNDSSLNSLVLSPEAHSLVSDCPECGTPKYHWERVGTNWHCPKCDGDFPIASASEDLHEGIESESFGKSETGPLGRDEEEEEEKDDLGDTDDFEKPRGRYGDSTEIKVSLIAGEYHVRLYANDKLVDEMACKNKSDLGWVSRDMMMWYSKMGGNSAHAESARDRHGKESSVTPAGVRYLGKNLKESRLWMQPTKAPAVNEGFFDKRMEDEDEEELAESTMGADGEWDLDAKISRALGNQRIMREGIGANNSDEITRLATIADEALDNAYHYGRSQPGNSFGWLANMESAKAAKEVIDSGVTDIEEISYAIHDGWNITAEADYNGELSLEKPTPDEKKAKRHALAQKTYTDLPEEEKEKDRVVARVLLQALGGEQPLPESRRRVREALPGMKKVRCPKCKYEGTPDKFEVKGKPDRCPKCGGGNLGGLTAAGASFSRKQEGAGGTVNPGAMQKLNQMVASYLDGGEDERDMVALLTDPTGYAYPPDQVQMAIANYKRSLSEAAFRKQEVARICKRIRESMSNRAIANDEAKERLLGNDEPGDFGLDQFVTDEDELEEDELEEDRAGMREAAEDLGDVGDFEKPGPSPTYTLKYTIYPSRGIGQPKRKTIKFKARNNLSALKITLFKLSFDYDIPNAWATFLEELPEYVDGEINEENLKAALDYNAEEYSVESLTDAAGNLIYTIGEDSDDEEEEWDEMEESTTHESRIREENEKVFAVADSLKSVLDIFFPELKGVYMDAMESGDADALKTLIHTIDQEVLGEPASYNEETVRICKRIREYLQ